MLNDVEDKDLCCNAKYISMPFSMHPVEQSIVGCCCGNFSGDDSLSLCFLAVTQPHSWPVGLWLTSSPLGEMYFNSCQSNLHKTLYLWAADLIMYYPNTHTYTHHLPVLQLWPDCFQKTVCTMTKHQQTRWSYMICVRVCTIYIYNVSLFSRCDYPQSGWVKSSSKH